jgi:hypothetical protein
LLGGRYRIVVVALAIYGFVTACGSQQLRQGFFGEE